MDSQCVYKFLLNKFGKGYHNQDLCIKQSSWLDWYKGFDKEFHVVKVSNGLNVMNRKLYRLNMAKRVCEDWVSAIMSEGVDIVINSSAKRSSIFVQGAKGNKGVLGSNNFSEVLPCALELMFALGTSAIVLGLDDIMVDTSSGVVRKTENTKITLEAFSAVQIFPITYRNGVITEVCFVKTLKHKGSDYYLLSSHVIENGEYVIYNDILSSGYSPVSLDIGVINKIRTSSPAPLFCIFKTNIVNSIDIHSPLGVSIYADSLDNLKACDVVYDSCIRDIITGQRIVMLNKNLLTTAQDGTPIAPQDVKQSYMQFFGDDASAVDSMIKEFAPKLNTTDLDNELQNQLNMLSNKCGLGTRFYNFNISSGVTATEYVGERNDFYRNCRKLSSSIAEALSRMVTSILILGKNIFGQDLDISAKVVVELKDGVVESDKDEREQDRLDVKDGLMSREEYRMKWYNETSEEASKAISQIDSSRKITNV